MHLKWPFLERKVFSEKSDNIHTESQEFFDESIRAIALELIVSEDYGDCFCGYVILKCTLSRQWVVLKAASNKNFQNLTCWV